jgi:acetylornithine aminotransferase
MSLEQQQKLEATYLMQTYGRKPVQFVKGEGIRLYDDTGAEYLDFLGGIGAVSVGHSNPRVVSALREQASKLVHVGNYYYVEGRGELAKKISDLLNRGAAKDAAPWRVFFANSGAEAIEGAIKIARKYGAHCLEGADTIVSARRSFHGRTLAALAATGQPSKQDSFKPLPPGFVHVDLNDLPALKAVLNQGFGGKSACAVLLECIQGEGGVYPVTEEYLQAARQLTEDDTVLLMLDEVQTGFYRTGTYPFAFQHYGIMPDVVTLAKGLGSGVPIGAIAARGRAAEIFEPGDHGSTFGGSPLVVAAANATLDELATMDAGAHVTEVGAYLQERLKELPFITEVRGRGLMVGAELSKPIAGKVVDVGLEASAGAGARAGAEAGLGASHEVGLVLNSIGHHILRFLPPLVCTKADVDVLITRLRKILEEL